MKTLLISHTRCERSIFFHRPWKKRRKTILQSFSTHSNISNQTCFGFSQNLPGSDSKLTEKPQAYSVPTMSWLRWKLNIQPTSWCFEWSLAMVMWWLHLSFHIASDSMQRPTLSTWIRLYCSELSGWLLEDSAFGKRTLLHSTQAGEPNIDCEKISATSSLLTSGSLNLLIAIALWGTVEWETNKSLCSTKDELKARMMATYTNLNQETNKKSYKRLWSNLVAMAEANGNSFE